MRFPGKRQDCENCHAGGSQNLPLSPARLAVATPRWKTNPTGPESAACLGCHITEKAALHAAVSEACGGCHLKHP